MTVEVVNADEIARALPRADPRAAAFEARQMATDRISYLFQEKSSFGIETTLNLEEDLRLIRRAAAAGYDVDALIIWSGSLETSLNRVKFRVDDGSGHHVPPDEIRLRYNRAVGALAPMLGAVTTATVIDNSRPVEEGPEIVLQAEGGVITVLADRAPDWLRAAFGGWFAPLSLGADLTELAADPRVYRALGMLAEHKRKAASPPRAAPKKARRR